MDLNNFYILFYVRKERLQLQKLPRRGERKKMDRLLLHHHRSYLLPDHVHHSLRLLEQKYPPAHSDHYLQVNYPTETSGKLCYYDLPNYPYVFFVDPHNPSNQRYCVSQCPSAGQQLQCANATACAGLTSNYSTAGVINRLGGLC
jgi:hypothetical protein